MSSKSGRQLLYTPVIKGTIILTIAGLLCRILGFYYRIFLNSHIGSYGMGMLQLVLPLCGIAFSVCMCGFNSAISKYTAQTHGNINVLLGGLLMSFPLSCIFSAVCATFSYEIADKLMFNADCAPLIQIIAIGIPLSAIHSCICGYYYGCKKTFIPAISQIIEQLIRIFSVIIYYHLISGNLETLTVTDALYGNIAGEVCADIFCIGCVYVNNKQNNKNNKIIRYEQLLLRSPEPQAINKNIIGATQLFNPPKTFPQHPVLFMLLTALLQQQGSQQHS